jgi:hypothetical protein
MSPLSGLFTFTLRLWRANLVALLVAAFVGSAAVLLGAALLEGTHSAHAFSGSSLIGLVVNADETGSHLHLDIAALLTDLVAVAATAWATCTMVALLVRHVRLSTRPGLRDLGCGLPFWGWVVVVALLQNLVERLSGVPSALWFVLGAPAGLIRLVVVLAFATVFLLYIQEVVDEGHDALGSLAASWRLVRAVGFWRVLGNYLLFTICITPILTVLLTLAIHFGTHSATGAILDQLMVSVLLLPLTAAFTTAMYLLARGDRARVEAVLGPAGPNTVTQPPEPLPPSTMT